MVPTITAADPDPQGIGEILIFNSNDTSDHGRSTVQQWMPAIFTDWTK